MNSDSLIQEENNMQSAKAAMDETEFQKITIKPGLEITGDQGETIPEVTEENLSRVAIEVDSGENCPKAADVVVNSETLMPEDERSLGAINNPVTEAGTPQEPVLNDSDIQLRDTVQGKIEHGVSSGINETELDEIVVDQIQENSNPVSVPDAVLREAVDDIARSTTEDTSEEEVLPEAVENNRDTDKNIIDQVGHLTRNLHDSLRELGYDKRLENLAAEVPEAQDKLTYIAAKTEQAADRTLNATEVAMPIQEKLSSEAAHLSEKWKQAFEEQREQPDTEKFKLLLIETLSYIDKVPEQTDATNAQLMEIMMAQDFQDLTGQVIKKVTHMVQRLEHDLVQLLLANVPVTQKQELSEQGLMNGPVVNPEKSSDTVNNQDQVDDLLASLGF